jgi:hypothetical protein
MSASSWLDISSRWAARDVVGKELQRIGDAVGTPREEQHDRRVQRGCARARVLVPRGFDGGDDSGRVVFDPVACGAEAPHVLDRVDGCVVSVRQLVSRGDAEGQQQEERRRPPRAHASCCGHHGRGEPRGSG